MKTVFSNRNEPVPSFWMGALVHSGAEDDGTPRPYHSAGLSSNRIYCAVARERAERLTDLVLAVVFVAGCALMGWAGTSWL